MLLIKQAMIVDPGSSLSGKKQDILIKKGKIERIGTQIKEDTKQITGENLVITPGWFDVGVFVGDPGYEHREDLASVSAAACRGGFTGLACWPNTDPPLHSKSEVQYIKQNGSRFLPAIYPIGALSVACRGKDITEIYDMRQAGALAFSDGLHAVQDSGLMLRALLYVKPFEGIVIHQALDRFIAPEGQVHEGVISTGMGLTGIPSMAEELMIQRDLFLAEYADSKIHFINVTSAGSVDRIRQAKEKGIKVTASVALMNLIYTDKKVESFDAEYKVFPPLREKKDQDALLEGLKDGTLDFIDSNHIPLEEELKDREFSEAGYGAINLQTAAAQSWMHLADQLGEEKLVACWTSQNRQIFGLETPQIREGADADLAVFDRDQSWVLEASDIASKSRNTPLVGQSLRGKTLAVVRGNKQYIYQ